MPVHSLCHLEHTLLRTISGAFTSVNTQCIQIMSRNAFYDIHIHYLLKIHAKPNKLKGIRTQTQPRKIQLQHFRTSNTVCALIIWWYVALYDDLAVFRRRKSFMQHWTTYWHTHISTNIRTLTRILNKEGIKTRDASEGTKQEANILWIDKKPCPLLMI